MLSPIMLPAVAEERQEASLRLCVDSLGDPVRLGVMDVCSDMGKPYLNVFGYKLGEAIHVLDRFHVMQRFGKALDEIRAEEACLTTLQPVRRLDTGDTAVPRGDRECDYGGSG